MLIDATRETDETIHHRNDTEGAKKLPKSEDGQSCGETECDLCHPMLHAYRTLPKDPTLCEKTKYYFSCPPHGKIGRILTWAVVLPLLWAAIYAVIGSEALPGGNLFSIGCLLVLAQVGGLLAGSVHLPPLLGMLVVGILLRSVPGLDIIGTSIDQKWSETLRKMALVVILTRAGLGLDPKALRQMSFMVLRLGFLPNLIEMTVVAVTTHFLIGFPWLWSIMLGFILSGVSPSVVVPCMLNLSDLGLGLDKGVPTLVIAGLSVDNVLSISGFGVLLGIIFSEGSIIWQAFKGPIEVLLGIGYGIIMGSLCWILPNQLAKNISRIRFVMLLSFGVLAIFGSIKAGFGGAGPLGCLATAFIAGIGWRKRGWTDDKPHPVKKNFNFLWKFFLPLLFGLIGTEIQVSALDSNIVGYGLVTLFAGLTFRVVTTYFCVLGGELHLKERIFVALSWIPKATVQAAIGSTALDMARSFDPDPASLDVILAKQVLTIAVLVILVAAPIGAAAIMISAPKLLNRKDIHGTNSTVGV